MKRRGFLTALMGVAVAPVAVKKGLPKRMGGSEFVHHGGVPCKGYSKTWSGNTRINDEWFTWSGADGHVCCSPLDATKFGKLHKAMKARRP